jgi:hypothetical protein
MTFRKQLIALKHRKMAKKGEAKHKLEIAATSQIKTGR